MERIVFEVESSSSGNEYTVTFQIEGGQANAYCTCQAGQNGSFCKHRVAIMCGDVDDLASENDGDVSRLKALLQGTDLQAAFERYVAAEIVFAESKKEFDAAKKELTRAMYR
jgi:uncharacterized Zn finger protein